MTVPLSSIEITDGTQTEQPIQKETISAGKPNRSAESEAACTFSAFPLSNYRGAT